MSAVSEDVLTSEQTASSAVDANPEALVTAAAPAPEANGSASPAAAVEQAPAPTASVSAPQAVAEDALAVSQSDFESMLRSSPKAMSSSEPLSISTRTVSWSMSAARARASYALMSSPKNPTKTLRTSSRLASRSRSSSLAATARTATSFCLRSAPISKRPGTR
jgi:hypothetical protein